MSPTHTHTHRIHYRVDSAFPLLPQCRAAGVITAERQRVSTVTAPVVHGRLWNSRSWPFVAITDIILFIYLSKYTQPFPRFTFLFMLSSSSTLLFTLLLLLCLPPHLNERPSERRCLREAKKIIIIKSGAVMNPFCDSGVQSWWDWIIIIHSHLQRHDWFSHCSSRKY